MAARRSWTSVAALLAALALLWPAESGRSLAVRTINWLADPHRQLPRRPSPLAIGVDDDADVVTAHDLEEHAYDEMSRGPWTGRLRLRLRDAQDPFDPSTERPLIVAVGLVAAVFAVSRRKDGGSAAL